MINALERAQREVAASRAFVSELENQIKLKQDRIDALDARDLKREEIENRLSSELKVLQSALVSAREETAIKSAETDYLKSELAKVQKKYRAALKRERWLIAAGGVAALALKFLVFR